jgi:hypothetical protein
VCKHQLAHVSEFFRTLFLNNRALPQNGVKQLAVNEYTIVVSSLRYPPQEVQFQWFLECTVPSPVLRDISGETGLFFYKFSFLDEVLETCMRLSKRFSAKGLEVRCAKFIKDNVGYFFISVFIVSQKILLAIKTEINRTLAIINLGRKKKSNDWPLLA